MRDVTDEATRHNQAAYDQIAGLYAQRQAGSGRLCADLREAFAARLTPAATLADLGCGPAFDGASFAAAGHRVAGIDRSAGMLAAAGRVLPGNLVQADMRRLPVSSGGLDGIWCCAAVLHVPQNQTMAVLGEMRRVLRPGPDRDRGTSFPALVQGPRRGLTEVCRPPAYTWTNSMPVTWQKAFQSAAW
jgi:ubiquinone/menaquinone biosynthesis C-methylase UbiE